jgi:hypothetical protein
MIDQSHSIIDLIEIVANTFSIILVGAVFVELGLSRCQNRSFSAKSLWAIFLIVIGARIALKNASL